MHFKTRRILPAIVVIGAIAAGGAAYTAGSGFGSVPTAGYSGTAIQGPVASNLQFDYSQDGSLIQGATFNLVAPNATDIYTDASTYDVQAGFGTHLAASDTPGASDLIASNQPADSGTNPCTVAVNGAAPNYSVTCSFTGGVATGGIPVGDTTPAVVGASNSENNDVGPVNTGADQFNVLVTTIGATT